MSQSASSHPLDDPAVDPFDIARIAADQIAERTGVARHDIALTLGSGWAKAADLIGETTATIPAFEITGFSKPALEGHVGTLRSVLLPSGKRALVIGAHRMDNAAHSVAFVVMRARTDD
jgi:purine-nucleoside phosphorylase